MNAKAPHNQNVGSKKLQLRVNPVTSGTVATPQQPTPSSGSSKNKGKSLALAKVQNMNVAPPQQQADLLTRPSLTLNSTKNKNSQREWQALLMQQKARSTKNSKKDGGEKTKEATAITNQIQVQQAKKASFFTGNIQIAPVQELQRAISNDHAPEIRSNNIHYKEGQGSTDARIFTCSMAAKQRSQNQTVQHQQLRISKKSPTARVSHPHTTQQMLLNQKATKTISPVNIAALQDSGDDLDGQKSKKVIEVINIRKRYEVESHRLQGEEQSHRKGLHNQAAPAVDTVLNTTSASSAQKNKQRTSSDTKIKQKIPVAKTTQQQPAPTVKSATIRSKGSSNHSTKQGNQPCSSVGSGNNSITGPKSSLQHNAQNLRARLASKSNERGAAGEEVRTKVTTAPQTGRSRANNAGQAAAELQRVNKGCTRVKKQAMQIFAQTKGTAPTGKVTKNLYLGDDEVSSPQKLSNSSTKNLINSSFQFNSSHHTNTADHINNESFGGSGTGSNPPPVKSTMSKAKANNGPQIKIKTTHNTQTYALAQPSMPYTCQAAEEKGIFFQANVEKVKEPGTYIVRKPIKDLKTSKRIISSGSGPRTSTGISPKNGISKQAPAMLNIAPPPMDMKKHATVPFSTQNIRLVNEQMRDVSNEQQSLEKAKQVVKRPKKFNFGSLKNVQQIPEDEGEIKRKEKLNSSQERQKTAKQTQFKVMAENKNTNSNASISQTRKSISAKKTTSLKQPQGKNVALNSVQKTTSKILLEDTRPVQNVGRGAVTTKECYSGGFLQSADEAPANEQDGHINDEANKSFDMARFRMHYENRTTAASHIVAPKKIAKKVVPPNKTTSIATDPKGKILREDEQHTLAAIVSKLKMQNKSDVGKNQYTQKQSPETDNNHLKSQQSYKPKQGAYTTTQIPPPKVNNLSSSDFGDDSFTFSSLVHLQAKLDEHDMSGYAASQSASGTYQVKAKTKRNAAVVQKLSGELVQRETDIKKLISELQNRDTVIHTLKEEMGMLVDQIKQGEQKREKSKERIKSLINKVEQKLQKFTHLTDLNNCQLQQLRQYDSSRKNTESDQDDSKVLSTKNQLPVTIKLKNIRPSNKTPTIQPSNKSSFVAGVLARLGDDKEEEKLDLLATKSKENNRAATEINIGYGANALYQPNLKRTVAISKLNLHKLRANESSSSIQQSPMTIAEFTESQMTLPCGTLQSSNSQKQFSTNSWNNQGDSLEASLVTVAACSFADEEKDDIIRQLNGGKKRSNKHLFNEDSQNNEQSMIQLEHEWERAQRELEKQSEQVRSLLKPAPVNSDAQLNNFFDKEEKKTPHMYLQLDKLSRTEKLVDLNQIEERNEVEGQIAFYVADGKVTSRFGGRQATNESQDEADEEAKVIVAGKTKSSKDAPFSKTMSKGSLQQKRFQISTPQELQVENSQPAQCYGLSSEAALVKTTKSRPKHKLITRSKERSAERSFDAVPGARIVKKQAIQMIKRQSKSPNDPTTKFLLQKSFDYAKQQDEENSPRQTRPKPFRQGGQGQGNQISLNSASEVEKSRDTSALKKQMLMMAALKAQNQQRQQNAKQGDLQKEKQAGGQTKLRLHVLKTNANACTTAQTVKNSQNIVRMTRQLDDEASVLPITGGKNTPTSRKSKHIIN